MQEVWHAKIWWGHWQWLSRRGRSVLEDGLNNLSWETGCYELCYAMMLCYTHSFHNSRQGWKMVPPARERRSRHTGISHGESSRRPTRASNHGQHGQYGTTNNRQTSSQQTLSRTPGSRAIGGNAYRWSLGHICTIASSQIWAGWVRENQRGQCEVSRDANKSTWARPNFFQICSITSLWSIHSPGLSPCLYRMSAPWLRYPGM